jgi:hypothetical protein
MLGSIPSETKEETTNNRLRAMDVGALITLRTFACTKQKEGSSLFVSYCVSWCGEKDDGGTSGKGLRVLIVRNEPWKGHRGWSHIETVGKCHTDRKDPCWWDQSLQLQENLNTKYKIILKEGQNKNCCGTHTHTHTDVTKISMKMRLSSRHSACKGNHSGKRERWLQNGTDDALKLQKGGRLDSPLCNPLPPQFGCRPTGNTIITATFSYINPS